VEFTADSVAALALERNALEQLPRGAIISLRVVDTTGSERMVSVEGTDTGVRVLATSGDVNEVATKWLVAFLEELDRHTAFAAQRQVPLLLANGGVPAVLARARVTAGNHAGLRYLIALVSGAELSSRQVVEVLQLARVVGDNEAERVRLLLTVRERHGLADGAIRDAYRDTAAQLRTVAGRGMV
jgi:hypothetical protein